MKVIIYALIDPRSEEIKYVGKTNNIKKRIREHIRDEENNLKYAWIKSLKKINLEPGVLILEETNVDESNFWEIFWISQCKSWGFELKNMTNGGDGSYGAIPWNKGKKGVFKHSKESKDLMSAWRKENTIGEKNGFFGKKHSKESKEKQRQKSSLRRWSEEFKENRRGEKSINCKKIYQYDLEGNFIREYKFGKQVENFGFNSNVVSKVCRGINKTHKGFFFSFEKKLNVEVNKHGRL